VFGGSISISLVKVWTNKNTADISYEKFSGNLICIHFRAIKMGLTVQEGRYTYSLINVHQKYLVYSTYLLCTIGVEACCFGFLINAYGIEEKQKTWGDRMNCFVLLNFLTFTKYF
jgi:hypothetical protein